MNPARTLTHPAVWLGLLGSLVLTLGELRRLATWPQVRGQAWAATVSGLVPASAYVAWVTTGILLLSLAWLLLRPDAGRPGVNSAAVFALWATPLLVVAPVLSTDAGSYADLGWMMAHGVNPYDTGLGTTDSPFAWGRAWRGTTSVYPAGILVAFGWVIQATGAHWFWSVAALRILALVGIALLLWAVPRLAREHSLDPAFATWLAVLNPITIVHGVGGEHVDLLMAGLVAAGLAVASRPGGTPWVRLAAGGVLLGLAASVKQPALLAAPAIAALALRDAPPRWWRTWGGYGLASGVAVTAFLGVSALSGLGLGWLDGTGNPANASQTITPAFLLSVLTGADVDALTTGVQVVSVVGVGALLLVYGRRQPLRFVALAAATWALGFGTLREWYLIFPLAFLGLAAPGRALRGVIWVLVPLFAVYGVFREYQRVSVLTSFGNALWLALAVAGVAWAVRAGVRALRRPDPAPAALVTT